MLAALALAAAVASAAPPRASVLAEVEALTARRAFPAERAREQGERFALESEAAASSLAVRENFGVRDAKTRSDASALTRRAGELETADVAAAVESVLISRRLDVYARTGTLPPPLKDDGALARAFEFGRPASSPPKLLELDLVALARQLRLPPPPRAQTLPAPAAAPAIVRRPAPEPVFAARGGRAASTDPLPALIFQMYAREARARALAADELAACGARAASAAPVLRRALADSDPRVRASSAAALGAIIAPDDPMVADLRRMLVDADEGVRLSAADALHRLGR